MSKVTKFILLSSAVKSVIESHVVKCLGEWGDCWELSDGVSERWQVLLSDQYIKFTEQACNIDNLFLLEGSFFVGVDSLKSKKIIANSISKSSNSLLKGDLFPYLVDQAVNDLQLKLVVDFVTANESFNSFSVYEGGINDNEILLPIEISRGDLQLYVYLSSTLIERLAKDVVVDNANNNQGGLSDRLSSLSNELLGLNAEYASVNLTVEELASIKVGDVIRLDKSIVDPMPVYNNLNDLLFSGHLGLSGSNLALKVVKN